MENRKLFNKLYFGKPNLYGSRVVDSNLQTEFLPLFVECPCKFKGETKLHKYYLLKKKWQVIKEVKYTCHLISKHPTRIFTYTKWLFEFMFDLNKSWEFYMSPEKVNY